MGKLFFKSVRTRFIFWFLTISLIPLLVSYTAIIFYFNSHIKAMEIEKLCAIRELKISDVRSWLDEREGDILTLSQIPLLNILEQSGYFQNKSKDNSKPEIRLLRKYLQAWVSNFKDYNEIFILNAETGEILISSNETAEGLNKSGDDYYTVPINTKRLYIKDIYHSSVDNQPAMAFAAPVFSSLVPGKVMCILVARINLETVLYPLLLNRIGLGTTGESLLVNKDGLVLSELRFIENAALKLKLTTKPAEESSRGISNVAETIDYRGEPIMAAYAHIPETRWGFIVKRDIGDMLSAINYMYVFLLIIILISIAVVIILAVSIAQKITNPINAMVVVAGKLMKGEFDNRISKPGDDEFGFLAKTINKTADALQSRIRIQQGESEIAAVMIHANDLDTFSRGLLQKMIDITSSTLGAAFLVANGGKELIPIVGIGINSEALRTYDIASLEGDMGEVILKNEILHVRSIPPDIQFTYSNILGEVLPRELLYIPLSLGNSLHAMIVLGTLRCFTKEVLTIIEHTQVTINTAFANLQSNLQTRKLAIALEDRNTELLIQSEKLQQQTEELQTQSEELQSQSNELQAQNVELEMQKKQVDDANRLKSEFLSNMSHELRTPLNSIMALSRVLNTQAKNKLNTEELNYLEIIERNGKLLLSLINDILDLSRIEAGKMDISLRSVSVKEITGQIVGGLEPLCQNKSISLEFSFPGDFPRINSDEKKVYQIIQNIVGNAVKFTSKGGVTITGTFNSSSIKVSVNDTGIGISKENLPHIFEEFRQVDGTSSRSYEGSGLGLAIARKLVTLLGGKIFAESELGKGSVFHIILPLVFEGDGTHSENSSPFIKSLNEIQPRTILIVDDEPSVINLIAQTLAREGYRTAGCHRSSDAVEMAERIQPYAITLDVLMPEIDGWEILQNLKKNQKTSHIPVIMISVSPDKDTGFALGAMGYLMKPLRPDLLLREIHRVKPAGTKTILVVDDNLIERSEVCNIVKSKNFVVFEADSGHQAITQLKKQLPDLILLDLMMPGMDGFEFLDRIRLDPQTKNIPVIIITAKDLSTQEKTALQGKVSALLVKGTFDSDQVLNELTKLLRGIEEIHYSPADDHSRILLVDDNEIVIMQIKTVLEPAGYKVDIAHGGQEALEYIKSNIPDGIILDLMMPGVDGFMVLESIRREQATSEVPVLILTAKTLTREDLSRLTMSNIKQLIHKGDVDKTELLEKIKKMVSIPADGLKNQEKKEMAELKEDLKPKQTVRNRVNDTKKVILLVEDNQDNIVTVKAVLGSGFTLEEATDGIKALKILESLRPDLILLDMGLPEMDGLTVLRKIRENSDLDRIPVIALTAHAMKDDRQKYLEAGCSDYISKPFDPDLLTEKVQEWCGK